MRTGAAVSFIAAPCVMVCGLTMDLGIFCRHGIYCIKGKGCAIMSIASNAVFEEPGIRPPARILLENIENRNAAVKGIMMGYRLVEKESTGGLYDRKG